MFFRNLRVYRFNRPIPWTQEELAERLDSHRFVPCQSQDSFRLGWSAPALAVDGEALTYDQGSFTLIALRREDKVLPGSVVKEAVEQRAAEIELREQRRIGKKEKADLKEQAIAELLPKAFSRSKLTFGYIDFDKGLLWVDTGSNNKADEFTSCLREAVGSLPVQFVELKQTPVVLFTEWVSTNQSPVNFEMGDQCELRSSDGADTVIRCKGTESLHDAVNVHIENGMEVAELSLIWEEKLKITVNEAFNIKRIKPLDLLNDKEGGKDQNAADRFMGSVSLMTLEFAQLFIALTEALGGEDLSNVEGEIVTTATNKAPAVNTSPVVFDS